LLSGSKGLRLIVWLDPDREQIDMSSIAADRCPVEINMMADHTAALCI
jgi:hypothetical protein